MCDIYELETKINVLRCCWDNSRVATYYTMHNITPPEFNYDHARNSINTYIDYFCGRLIKTDFGNYGKIGIFNRFNMENSVVIEDMLKHYDVVYPRIGDT